MCEKAVNAYLLALRFVPDWFATSKMLKMIIILFFNVLDSKYDSDIDSDDDSGYIKSLKHISWFNKYNQGKEYKNMIDKEYKTR